MPTGQTLITNAVTALNIIDAGGAISASENADLLQELNTMLDAWSTDDTLVPSITTAQYALVAAQASYTMGTGGNFNIARPVRIDQATFVSTVGAALTRRPLRIVASTDYFTHADLAAAASTSEELYIDWADAAGLMKLYFYPAPACPTACFAELEAWNPITSAWTLAGNVNLPPGYQDAIQQGLSYRCLSRYGAVVNSTVAQIVTDLGKQAKMRIQKLNVQNRLLDPALLQQVQPQQAPQQPAPQGR